jgi:hypothetical protein
MSWREALKQYNASSGNPYVIPKKGSDAYNKVKSIQEKLGGTPIASKGKGMNGIEAKLNKSAGKGFIKDSFAGLVKRVNGAIDSNLEPVEGNVPLAAGEMHSKKITRKDGKLKYENYNFLGPGTKVEERLAKGVQPINQMDDAARTHDQQYTLDFQKRMKEGQKVSKLEVQLADKRFVDKVKKNKKDDIVLATAIPPLFAAKKLAEDTGVLSHTSFFDPKTTGKGMKKSGSGIQVIKKKATKKVPK